MEEIVKVKELLAKEEKLAPIRKAIAKNLKNAMDHVTYCSLVTKVDATELWNYRKAVLNDVVEKTGVKLTFLSFIVKAVAITLSEQPMFSAKVDEEAGVVKFPGELNIGIAVDTPYGLVVPVIRNVEKLSIVEIQQEIVRLAGLARDKKLKMSDMQGACFTITNIGTVGALYGTPIMNYPEIAILATGAIIDDVVVKDKQFVAAKSMWLTIAADHRWVDGGDMGRFNYRVKELLEQPEKLGDL
ncbi:2-oxo acid dehydrogenase subunit E2 [Mycoplasma sp. 3341]|uniref:2-oxo acid dehydrogenase subunit E2 n=1 Tax=Mycoplasma sp. 3341 TaxID=3447506 RepID=UPI003F65C969